MSAILFGSISTISDTSELQRHSFNEAFQAHDLLWHWDREDYRQQLTGNGGAQRIADYAEAQGVEVDATAVHRSKSEIFQQKLASAPLSARAGVTETIRAAKEQGLKVGLVTTTSPENVSALLAAVAGINAADFDLVVDSSHVSAPKPDPAAYELALQQLGEDATDAVAIEDNVGGIAAARAAGVTTIAFPNENTADHDFADADQQVEQLDTAAVTGLVGRD